MADEREGLDSVVNHEHPESIADRFVDGFMHPGLEHDAERLARGYKEIQAQVEQLTKERDDLLDDNARCEGERSFQRLRAERYREALDEVMGWPLPSGKIKDLLPQWLVKKVAALGDGRG